MTINIVISFIIEERFYLTLITLIIIVVLTVCGNLQQI